MFGRFSRSNGDNSDQVLEQKQLAGEIDEQALPQYASDAERRLATGELSEDEELMLHGGATEEEDEEDFEWLESEDDPLVRRLRNLKWPEVRPELRERCWKAICERVEQQQAERERAEAEGKQSEDEQRRASGEAS